MPSIRGHSLNTSDTPCLALGISDIANRRSLSWRLCQGRKVGVRIETVWACHGERVTLSLTAVSDSGVQAWRGVTVSVTVMH